LVDAGTAHALGHASGDIGANVMTDRITPGYFADVNPGDHLETGGGFILKS
jgi:hypothetical protein